MTLMRIVLAITGLTVLAASAGAEEAGSKPPTKIDPEPGWPMASGPFGNYTARTKGLKLVDDAAQIRLAWKNETADLGWAKGNSSVGMKIASQTNSHPGSFSGPILAAGQVFAASFRPSGTVFTKNARELPPEQQANWKKNASILADDILVAVDFETGKEVWRAEEKEAGLSHPMSKRGGWNGAPVYCNGFVVALGTLGVLRGYDAETGEKRWETPIEPVHGLLEAKKKEALARQAFPDQTPSICLPLLAVGGVVIVGQFHDGTVCGVEPASGKVLWSIPNAVALRATPGVWRHEGKEYLITCSNGFDSAAKKPTGVLRCIEPVSGKALWSVPGVGDNFAPLIVEGDTVMLNLYECTVAEMVARMKPEERDQVLAKSPNSATSDKRMCILGAYRLSLTGATPVWRRPGDLSGWNANWHDTSGMRHVIARDGRAYNYSRVMGGTSRVSILEVETGKELAGWWANSLDAPLPNRGQSFLVEDLLLNFPDAAHSDRLTGQLYSLKGDEIKPFGGVWKPEHSNTTGYETFMETPIADGKIVMRSQDGGLACYDLRKKN